MTFIPQDPYFEQAVKEKISSNYFTHYLGFKIEDIQAGAVGGKLKIEHHHLQQMGFVHGGVTATLSDIVMGFAAFSLVPRRKGVVTVELKTSYLNPAKGDTLYAKGYVIKAGQKLFFCEAELWVMNETGEKIQTAKSSSIMAVVEGH